VTKRFLVAVLAMIALVAACGSDGSSEGDGSSDGDARSTDMPREVVAALGNRLVVLSSEDGSIVRTLVEGQAGITSAAVSADGDLVYFTRDDPDVLCGEGHATQIATVPIGGGPVQIYASGREPVPSPDGRWLAYLTGGPDQCGVAGLLAIEALGTEEFSQQLIPLQGEARHPWAWSSDSQRLLFQDGGTLFTIDPAAAATAEALPITGNPLVDAAYLGSSNEVAVGEHIDVNLAQVAAQNLETGKTRRLFRIPDFAMSGFNVDSSGRHIVLWGASDDGRRPTLYRWSRGGKPRELATAGINPGAAAWVPVAS
jgi:dipeptidyl aminopeptidase/acylaminoacyl peptidase